MFTVEPHFSPTVPSFFLFGNICSEDIRQYIQSENMLQFKKMHSAFILNVGIAKEVWDVFVFLFACQNSNCSLDYGLYHNTVVDTVPKMSVFSE